MRFYPFPYPPSSGGRGTIDAELVIETLQASFDRLDNAFSFDTRNLHSFLECEMPYALWCHHEIKTVFEELKDYSVERAEDGRLRYWVSSQAAQLLTMRQPTRIGTAYRMFMTRALKEYTKLPGKEHLQDFGAMWAEAHRFAEESDRLEKLFAE